MTFDRHLDQPFPATVDLWEVFSEVVERYRDAPNEVLGEWSETAAIVANDDVSATISKPTVELARAALEDQDFEVDYCTFTRQFVPVAETVASLTVGFYLYISSRRIMIVVSGASNVQVGGYLEIAERKFRSVLQKSRDADDGLELRPPTSTRMTRRSPRTKKVLAYLGNHLVGTALAIVATVVGGLLLAYMVRPPA
jgi:hypothetical protein